MPAATPVRMVRASARTVVPGSTRAATGARCAWRAARARSRLSTTPASARVACQGTTRRRMPQNVWLVNSDNSSQQEGKRNATIARRAILWISAAPAVALLAHPEGLTPTSDERNVMHALSACTKVLRVPRRVRTARAAILRPNLHSHNAQLAFQVCMLLSKGSVCVWRVFKVNLRSHSAKAPAQIVRQAHMRPCVAPRFAIIASLVYTLLSLKHRAVSHVIQGSTVTRTATTQCCPCVCSAGRRTCSVMVSATHLITSTLMHVGGMAATAALTHVTWAILERTTVKHHSSA